MVKKFTLMFLLGIFGLFSTNLFAQDDATIDPSQIKFWIGEGQNEVVFIVNWNEPDTALAWGYRFSEDEITLKDVMDGIVAVDPRFGYEGTSYVSDITFNDGILNLNLVGMYWMSIKNGEMCMNYFDAEPVHNGDYVKWGDESCGILLDPVNYVYVWTTPVQPVSVYNAVEEVEASMLTVYPNPATEVLYVNADNVKIVEIYDMTGRMVQTAFESVVDLRNIEAGVYFVTVKTDNAARTTKLVVK